MDKKLYKLTNPQKSIWVTEEYFKGTAINTLCGYVYISETVNFDLLKKAINEVIKTNDAMRMKLKQDGDSCLQYVGDYKEFDIDTALLPSKEDIEKKALEMANAPFIQDTEFLFKYLLYKLPNGSGGFIVNVHHLIGDSWSLGLIAKETTRIYSELLAGTYEPHIQPSYISYIEAENEYKNSEKWQKDKVYWDDVFKTIPEIASLTSVKSEKKDEVSCVGKREKFILSQTDIEQIKTFCDKYRISIYNFFMAVYSLYLSRISSLDDFVMGTPILNRTNFDQKHTMGMFISVAPLRVTLNHENSFVDFCKKIASDTMSVFRHQKYSYQTILEDVRKRDSSIPNLYNVILSYQITKAVEDDGVPYCTDWVFNGNSADELQIHLFDLNDSNDMTVAYDYKANLFGENEIANLHNRILTIIHQVISNDSILLKDIDIVTPEEKHQILYDFNNTTVDYPRDKTIVDLFEEQVEKTPNNIAVIFEDQKLTYKELNEKANQLANYLVKNDVKVGDVVGIMVHRSLEMIIAILSVLKSGATYLPIDPQYPIDRITYMLSDSESKILLVHNSTEDLNVDNNCKKINISLNKDIYESSSREGINNSTPSRLIYLIYTSGSTGNPKGVMITHQNIVNFIFGEKKYIEFSSNKVMVSVTTFCFDIFALELWGAITSGIPLVLANDIEQMSPAKLKELCIKNNVNMIQTTPSRYSTIINDIHNKDEFWNNFEDIMVGGEPFPKSLLERLRNLSNANIFNMYGPTETTVWSTIKNLSNADKITIGKPIANTSCYILDNNKKILPVGIPGELYIGGDGVCNGYWHRENLTKEKFTKSPFRDNEIIYDTGDLAYFNSSGELVHLGRTDSQVKIRGYRIELEEIENKIKMYSNIVDCVVIPVNSASKLCAYYISNSDIKTSDLRGFLVSNLPSYMVPNYFVKMDKFPYTPNGKIDKKNLPIPNIETKKEITVARNNFDNILIDILKDSLKLETVDISDSLYDIGGDSLTAINLATAIYNKLGISITVNDIFQHIIIKDLSDYISTLSGDNNSNTIKKAEKAEFYPVSSAQRRIYYASSMDNNSILYNIAGGIILNKNLDIELLNKCFKTLIDRHEVLRTHFNVVGSDIVQIIEDNIDFNLNVEKLDNQTLENVYSNFVKPFDLSKAPLFRAKVVELENDKMLLLLDMHHIISDGTSLALILQELCDLYNGKVLPEKQVDYKDFTLWEKEQFEKDDFKKSKDFWVNQYKDEIPLLNMPTTFARPSVQSFEGSNYHTKLSKEVFEKVNEVSKNLGITPYMLMLATYYILLSKYTSQDDIVVGTPIVGRELPELSNMLGMFVNTLALRNKVDHNSSFADFTKAVKDYCLEAFQNQAYPFDELVKELNVKRDTSRNALFDVVFAYQSNGYPKINFKDTQVEYYIPDANVAKFDLTLEVVPTDGELTLRYEYCTKLFDENFIQRFATHYGNILNAILENTDIKIADIDMLSDEERHQILYDFNNTAVDYPSDKTIVDLFEEQVEKTPDNIAVVFEDQKLTYKELNEKANQLANYLVKNDVKVGDIVGIYLNKSLEVVVSMFAILKAGAAFLPLDLDYPEDRLNYILENSKIKIILSSKNTAFKKNLNTIIVDLDEKLYRENDINNLNLPITPENLMYIMYTSGSTGKPKGVMVKHKNIVRLAGFPNFIEFSKNEVMVQTGTIVFDACIFEIFGCLLHGFKLYILKKENILDINFFSEFLEREKVTILFLTTGLFNQLGLQSPSMFKHLKYLLTGGDVISKESIQKIRACSDKLRIINCYGPTENGSYSTCYEVIGNEKIIPIGKPITNSTAYVVSPSGNLCPIGVAGELWVGGNGVARGYLNNENLTKEQFIKNPFGDGLIYKTGDLVKWLPDGNIEFIGRIDNQVKIRGFRIELSEIDRNILSHIDNIEQSLTMIQNVNNTKTICTYIVADSEIDIKSLKNALGKYLPTYMIPTFIMQLEEFPLSISHKVDTRAFPIPSIDDIKKEVVPARNELDETIISALSNVLSIENISIDDSFFDLGGDSLSAISFTNILSQEFGTTVTVGDVFSHPTIKDLSDYIATLSKNTNSSVIKKAENAEFYPVSSAQRRIYYASSMDNNSILYNTAGGIIVNKLLDIELLNKCFKTLIDRHEVLRTHFNVIDSDIVQIVEDSVDFDLNVEKLDNQTLENVYSNFVKPFDLSKAPLFRAKVVELENDKMLLLLDMHHIISDGTSLALILQELCDLYNGKVLPEKQVDYKDFTLWEKEQFEKDDFKKSKDFWVNQYKDEIPLLNMPTTYARPSVQSFEGSNYHTKLSREVFEKVNEVCKKLGVTPYMLMLATYYILLSKYTSQDDIVVGTPIVGRELPELSNMLGMFVNTLALRNKVDHNSSFADFIKSVKDYCLEAFQNQVYPFDELVKELNVKRDTSRSALFDVMFIYQNNGYPKINFNGTNIEYFTPDSNISKFDLSLEIVPTNDELSLRYEYCTKLFDEDFIQRFATHYNNILNAILENTDIKIADIDMLSEEERHQILYDFNNTAVDYPRDKTIVDLFEEQVEKTPDNIAVVFEDQKLTYKELNEKANQLAHYLVSKGISSNNIVGITLPRSLEMMISIWAVLKSGACYIPIDPTFPKERIEYMLNNSKAFILLKLNSVKDVEFNNIANIDINNYDIYSGSTDNLNETISPDSSSYIIYTSGSTGKPKGVVLKHKSLMNLTCYLNKVVAYLKPNHPVLTIASITTISFDIFIFETLISLQRGLKVVIANEAQQTNPSLLDELIFKHDVKAIQMTPSRMDVFINNKQYMPHLSNLEYITLAGEALPDELKDKLLALGNVTIYNGYGPSETTVFSTYTDVTSYPRVNIGRPLANTYSYILDKDKHLCPIGIPGELYLSGDGVGKGYLNNKELTDQSFMADIFNPDLVMYKTGDLVRYLPNGELDYIARVDNQVKIRGLRIELDEIQKWILQYKDINKTILSAKSDKSGRQYLVAYLTVNNRISINELKIYLGKHIPKYMIPTYFVIMDDFPYLPNGKIDKKSLPLPNMDVKTDKKYIAPTNKLEIEITQIFENLLSISPISIDDNFFDIGGDSLLAMSLQLELLKMQINVSYSDIFMFPTIRELANYIHTQSKASITKLDSTEFNKFNAILKDTVNMPSVLKYSSPGNILLTGVTGFLGAHILDSFLQSEKGKVYCLIRTEPGLTIEQKLLNKLHYYFDTKYDNLIGKRIIPVLSDITSPNLGLSQQDLKMLIDNVNVVINSAAKVTHYGNYSEYKKVNVDGVQNLVDFCIKNKKRFYQISTLSVSGNSFIDDSYIKQDFKEDIDFNENNFYINQSLDNVYIRSKFEAEKVVLNGTLNGLDGYIIRVGNLMNRFSDGKFQPNVNENAYINRLIAYYKIGCIPDYLLDGYLELTPIDYCADAVIKIVQHNCKENRIFHLLNHKNIDVKYFIDILNKYYSKITTVTSQVFIEAIDKILNEPNVKNILSGLINDFDENRMIVYSSPVKIKSNFTIQYLSKIGFDWPELNEEYVIKFLKFFEELNLLTRKDGN